MLVGKRLTTLLYNASAHGWTAFDFHARCDDKGPTIVLYKLLNGDCIGDTLVNSGIIWDKEKFLMTLHQYCLICPSAETFHHKGLGKI